MKVAPFENPTAQAEQPALGGPASQPLADAATAEVRVAPEAPGGGEVNLAAELESELADLPEPKGVDPQVREALDRLREGTREGLSPKDRYDLGVAYMGMGLVDDAVREFSEAKRAEGEEAENAARTGTGAGQPAARKAAPVRAAKKPGPARKAPVKKAPAKKTASRKATGKTPAKKGTSAVKKVAAAAKKAASAVKKAASGKASGAAKRKPAARVARATTPRGKR